MNLFDDSFQLEQEFLLLRPSALTDLEGLYTLADAGIWAHSSTAISDQPDMKAYLQKALDDREAGIRQQLTIWDKVHNRPIGCSSFEHISHSDKRIEIGWSWLGKAFQGKGYNLIAKYLMLMFAFEELDFERVEFRTRGTNIQSQKGTL